MYIIFNLNDILVFTNFSRKFLKNLSDNAIIYIKWPILNGPLAQHGRAPGF